MATSLSVPIGVITPSPFVVLELDSQSRKGKMLVNGDTYRRVWLNPNGTEASQGWLWIPPGYGIMMDKLQRIMFESAAEWSVVPAELFAFVVPLGFLGATDLRLGGNPEPRQVVPYGMDVRSAQGEDWT